MTAVPFDEPSCLVNKKKSYHAFVMMEPITPMAAAAASSTPREAQPGAQ
jgi:hypothetical protein